MDNQILSVIFCTCVFLRSHRSIDDPLKGSYPIPLLRLRLTGEQELPVRRDNGDAVVPVVALRGRGQPRQHGVAVLLTADEDLAAGVGVLERRWKVESAKGIHNPEVKGSLTEGPGGWGGISLPEGL